MTLSENQWNSMLVKERDAVRKKFIEGVSNIEQALPYNLKCHGPAYFKQIMIMIKRHPEYNTKRFSNISDIVVRRNAINKKDLEFCVLTNNGELDAFSLKACCKKRVETSEQSKRRWLIEAMRTEILPQIQAYKKSAHHKCQMCGSDFDAGQLDVDHKPPLTFKKLSNIFIENNPEIIPDKFTNSLGQTKSFLPGPVHAPFRDSWFAFHEQNCVLRLLCKPCHYKSTKQV